MTNVRILGCALALALAPAACGRGSGTPGRGPPGLP